MSAKQGQYHRLPLHDLPTLSSPVTTNGTYRLSYCPNSPLQCWSEAPSSYSFVIPRDTHNSEAHRNTTHAQKNESIRNSGVGGVCLMSTKWRDEQHSSFINFISCFLTSNSFRLNFVPIAPDLIFNCGGLSLAFIFVINSDCNNPGPMFSRAQKLKTQFAHLYVVVILPSKEQNDSFVHSYFSHSKDIGRPTFVPALDLEMGFENIVRIAHARGVCKRHDAVSKLKAERERSVQGMNAFLRVVSSIPTC
ncbi:unnamed protein product [Lactuca saligna]|uniref:Uncharacterized protein n=1 Tax=Lactuca saligna TaxID=75948 RepID=A0AA35VT08_LACSI|nr:unnamed protein product [Lactuca saligna]